MTMDRSLLTPTHLAERELVNISAQSARLYLGGRLILGAGIRSEIVGSMELPPAPAKLLSTLTAHITVLAIRMDVIGAAAILISPSFGLAIDLALSFTGGFHVAGIGLDIDGAFRLRVNTTNREITQIGSQTLNPVLPAGPYFLIAITSATNINNPCLYHVVGGCQHHLHRKVGYRVQEGRL